MSDQPNFDFDVCTSTVALLAQTAICRQSKDLEVAGVLWTLYCHESDTVIDLSAGRPVRTGMSLIRKLCPSSVSDDEWALVAPYLTLVREDACQRADTASDVAQQAS